ncbi:MAG: hypothetical protein KGJ37_03675 [Verrucomicrobiota bacterium]|nr:hypothetical protein [Verrucomicrobiota bacterium]
MSLTAERLYELLPAIIRQRDGERGEPLRALLAAIAGQARVFEDDLDRLFDNLFIETCDEWVVPYIGDLFGVRGLNDIATSGFSQRAHAANTLSYRRRKGTATMLEQLARDTTGWPARAVEFFQLLGTTQWLNHLRPQNLRTPDLRDTNALELVDTAFDTAAHTADVRHIASGRGRHNIPNVGLFLWRLQNYPLENASACPAKSADGRYFFHPLGIDAPLFNSPQPETDIAHLAEEVNVPTPLRRRPLFDELEARRTALAAGKAPQAIYFGAQPVLAVSVRMNPGAAWKPIPAKQIFISDLSELASGDWRRPDPAAVGAPPNVAVDPVFGRLSFPTGVVPKDVLVSAAHGFPGDVGGGPYDRRESVAEFPLAEVDWQAGVSADFTSDPTKKLYATLTEAVDDWNTRTDGSKTGIIAIIDNRSYAEDLTGSHRFKVGEGERLLLVSADWPELQVPGGAVGQKARQFGRITATGRRAHVRGDFAVEGTTPANNESPGEFWIDGLLVEGALAVTKNGTANLGTLHLAHTTLVPASGGLAVAGGNEKLSVELSRVICGPIKLPDTVAALDIEESIIDAASAIAINARGARAEIQASTIRGRVRAQQLEAGNSIFTEHVEITRLQEGCVRFCYVLPKSSTPRRYRCQPDLALSEAKHKAEEALALARIVPMFTSDDFANPAYLQLARLCAAEIKTGAADGAEMGVWRFLRQPQRETNLRSGLDEYLRLGLEAGLFFVT